MTVAERVARLIEGKGWTQEEAAREMGVSRLSVGQLVSGKRTLTPQMAVRLSVVFSVPAKELLTDQLRLHLMTAQGELAEWAGRYRKQKGKGRQS